VCVCHEHNLAYAGRTLFHFHDSQGDYLFYVLASVDDLGLDFYSWSRPKRHISDYISFSTVSLHNVCIPTVNPTQILQRVRTWTLNEWHTPSS
jgi:hypothetical protein